MEGKITDDSLSSDNLPEVTAPKPTKPTNKREKRKIANHARHRLLSILKDAESIEHIIKPLVAESDLVKSHWPWIANKECGSWYLPPSSTCPCYFKSTDGHAKTYNVSLKRLNLPLLKVFNEYQGCVLVDSSVRKILPDSFSRTIPIWACALNRIARIYREELGSTENYTNDEDWDVELHTPASIVSPEEHATILSLIDWRVDLLHQSRAIVDPQGFVALMNKPIRPIWWSNGRYHEGTLSTMGDGHLDLEKYNVIVCCNPSIYVEDDKHAKKNHVQWQGEDDTGFYYTPGAADDHEAWAHGLTPEQFWIHKEKLTDSSLTEAQVETIIEEMVNEVGGDEFASPQNETMNANQIGDTNLWIGSRRAGRPPECWGSFDAILNVTENEYPNMADSIETSQKSCFYLQLVVAEGKRDRTELERLLPLGLAFLTLHIQQGRRALVHCAQGKDRSVAIALAFVALFCQKVYPLRLNTSFKEWDLEAAFVSTEESIIEASEEDIASYVHSGLPMALISALLDENARDAFLRWCHSCCEVPTSTPLATKESLRICLHLIQQDREVAEPTRSTMQKLNRFFMSSSMYR